MRVTGTVLPALLLTSTALALCLTLATGRPTEAGVFSVGIGSATVAPGSNVTVALNTDATADDGTANGGPGDGIGAFEIRVVYDGAFLAVNSCIAGTDPQWEIKACSPAYDDPATPGVEDNIVFFFGGSSNGAVGSGINLGSITFTAASTEGVAALDVQVDLLRDPADADLSTSVAPIDGTITVIQPSPTPPPTPSPSPTPSPAPKIWGDVNCDGAVTAVDALAMLRKVAGLPVFQVGPCPTIGSPYP